MSRNPLVTPSVGNFVEIYATPFEALPYSFRRDKRTTKKQQHNYMKNNGYRETSITSGNSRKILSLTTNIITTSEKLLYLTSQNPEQLVIKKKNRNDNPRVTITDNYSSRMVGVVMQTDNVEKTAAVKIMQDGVTDAISTVNTERMIPFSYLRVISRDEMRKIFKLNFVDQNISKLKKSIAEGTKLQKKLQEQTEEETAKALNSPIVNLHGKSLYGIATATGGDTASMSFLRRKGVDRSSRNIGSNLYSARSAVRNALQMELDYRCSTMRESLSCESRIEAGQPLKGIIFEVCYKHIDEVDFDMEFPVYFVVKLIAPVRSLSPTMSYKSSTNSSTSSLTEIRNQESVKVKLDYVSFMTSELYCQMNSQHLDLTQLSRKKYRDTMRELEDILLDRGVTIERTSQIVSSDDCIYVDMKFDRVSPTVSDEGVHQNWVQCVLVSNGLCGVNFQSNKLTDDQYDELVVLQQKAQSKKIGMWKHFNEFVGGSAARRKFRELQKLEKRAQTSLEDSFELDSEDATSDSVPLVQRSVSAFATLQSPPSTTKKVKASPTSSLTSLTLL